ncbi:MAG TPA: DUF5667 domain-containing protein [candidate division Zixibacteria bacterium]|nr:DUF5667 domain-containing protein [candidate division Zixibacteria bacterium]
MRLRNIMLASIILSVLAFVTGTVMADTNNDTGQANIIESDTDAAASDDSVLADDIDPEDAMIGPGHALYGLRIAFENLGTTFTFDADEKLGKQVSQARHRLAEAKAKLNKKDFKAAEIAFEAYEQEIDEANETISRISNTPGLLNAQLTITKHQFVLERLLNQTPNSTGLQRAYSNSLKLEKKFKEKTQYKFSRRMSKDGRQVLRKELKEDDEDEDKVQVKAQITDNGSIARIKLRFVTNSTNETDIANDTLGELQNLRNTLNDSLKLEQEDDEMSVEVTGTPTSTFTSTIARESDDDERSSENYKEKLKIEARVEGNITEVKVEYKFYLDATDRDGIIEGIENKLAVLTTDIILGTLDVEVKDRNKKEKIEISKDEKKSKRDIESKGKRGSSEKED